MKKFLKSSISDHDSGLIILGLPTGYGKTHHIIERMNVLLDSKKCKRNIYFITNQHVNIESVYDKIVDKTATLYLKSRSNILKNLLDEQDDLYLWFSKYLPKIKIKNKEVLEKVTLDILSVDGNDYVSKAISEIKNSITDYFLKEVNPSKTSFRKKFETWLKTSLEGKYIAKIFPEIELDKKRLILMTTKKMMLPLNYLYKSSKTGWEHIARDKKAIVFFDESDIVADEIQKSLFDNMINIDLLNSIKRIEINIKKLASDFLDDIEKKGLTDYCNNLIRVFESGIIDAFGASNTYYTKGDSWNTDKITLFKYLNAMYVASNDLFIKKIDNKLQNYIYNDKNNKYDYKISDLVETTLNFIDKLFLPTAYNFANTYIDDSNIDEVGSPEEELKVFLDAFLNTDSSCLKKYAQNAYTNLAYFKTQLLRRSKTFNFYKYGLDITTCEVANIRNVVNIHTHKCYLTKERVLENIAQNNLVFCVSATAEVYNPMVNFDMGYLRHALDSKYINVDSATKDELAKQYQERFKNTKNNIQVAPIQAIDEFGLLDDIDLDDYDTQRTKRCFGFIKEFAQSDMVVALAFFNKGLSDSKKLNEQIVIKSLQQYGLQKDNFIKINAKAFSQNVEHSSLIEERLRYIYSRSDLQKKLIIFTAYDSASAGVNLHYDIGLLEQGKLIGKKVDIDALYLDDINHLLSYKHDHEESSANQKLIAALYMYTYLYENDEISGDEYTKIIKLLQRNIPLKINGYKDLKAVNNKAVAKVIQAVGRICRTDNKRAVTRIFYSPGIAKVLTSYERENFVLTREFATLLDYVQSITAKDQLLDSLKKMNNHVTRISRKSKSLVDAFLSSINYNPKKESCDQWHDLRIKALKNPSVNNFEGISDLSELYLDTHKILDTYKDQITGAIRYVEETDYSKVHLVESGGMEISAKAVGLAKLMKIPLIRQYFEKNGYATDIDCQARYILSPIVFNNIYKGALGEVVVELLLSTVGVELEQLDVENFESMDYKVKGTDIYVDAKLVKPSKEALSDNLKPKLIDKANKLNARKLIFINVLETKTQEQLQQIHRYKLPNGTDVCIYSWVISKDGKLTQGILSKLAKEIEG